MAYSVCVMRTHKFITKLIELLILKCSRSLITQIVS